MIKSLIIAVTVSLPLLAQQEAPAPQDAPPIPGRLQRAAFMEKFDTNKDGQIDEQEKQAIRQAQEAHKAEFQKKLLEKYDANKDGQLDDQEKAAIKADFEKDAQQRRHMHRRGHGPGRPSSCCNCGKRPGPHPAFMEKFDTNKDGQIDEQEKQAIRQAQEARKAEFQKKLLEKYDANKDGQLDDQEKAAIKADFEKNAQQRRHMHRRGHGPGKPSSCCNCGKRPGPHPAFMEKFDTNKDGQIDEQEKQAIRQAQEARKAEFQKKLLEKYDANKDGQLDDQEKAAIKAAMEAKRAEFMKKIMDKYDANKDGQLDEQEKAAAKADFRKWKARGFHAGKMGHGPCVPRRSCSPNPPCNAPQAGCRCLPPPPPPCCSGEHRQCPCGPKHHHGAAPAPEAPPAPAE